MIIKLLTKHHLEFLSLKGGCRGSPESTHVKMPHCWESHALAKYKWCLENCSASHILDMLANANYSFYIVHNVKYSNINASRFYLSKMSSPVLKWMIYIQHNLQNIQLYEPVHEISNNAVCATSKGSDQPAHTLSLIRAFARRLNILWVLNYWPAISWSF